jgi:hypothetical protein
MQWCGSSVAVLGSACRCDGRLDWFKVFRPRLSLPKRAGQLNAPKRPVDSRILGMARLLDTQARCYEF